MGHHEDNQSHTTGVPEREERKKGVGNIFNEIMLKNFPNLERDLNIQFMKLIVIGHPKI